MGPRLLGQRAWLRDDTVAAPLLVALVNTMPGEARLRTEQQFCSLLAAAARGRTVRLRCYALDGATDGPAAERYHDAAWLEDAIPDGLIVTGMPPRAGALADEPLWPKLTLLVDLAVDHAIPTVWSCLAAHAAVLYLDGIERRALRPKLSGLLDCTRTAWEHPLAHGLPPCWRLPHSRYNDVPEAVLRAHGYGIVSRAVDAGAEAGDGEGGAIEGDGGAMADIFVKDFGVPFLFCQGHPEYDADTLLREYRRDVRAWLLHGSSCPTPPRYCLGPRATGLLAAFHARAARAGGAGVLAEFPFEACAADLRHIWRDFAVGLYDNWLTLLSERKPRRAATSRPPHLAASTAVLATDR